MILLRVTIAVSSGGGSLIGTTTVNAVAGVATFSGLAIHVADSYTLDVTDGSLTSATSASFTITADAASKLIITQQPTTTVAGQSISDIIVEVRDQYDNVVTTNTSNVTIALATGTGSITGTTTHCRRKRCGDVLWSLDDQRGNKTFTITDGSLTSATTNSTTISPDAADHLSITTQPSSGNAGVLSTIVVKVLDQYNNVVTGDTSSVSVAIGSGSGSLLGTTSINAVAGVATFRPWPSTRQTPIRWTSRMAA